MAPLQPSHGASAVVALGLPQSCSSCRDQQTVSREAAISSPVKQGAATRRTDAGTQGRDVVTGHLAELTASQFLDVWRHFDADGNGYIEGKELENFFQELESARKGAGVDSKNDNLGDKMKEFMHKYDKNADGKIEMAELAQILPTEENFLLCFRQHVGSSSEFMEAWRRYDTDRSGYIEANELKGFLSDLLKKANRPYDEPKLQEYTQTILRMFDMNGDGKLGLSEMSRLLPVQENFLLKFQGMKLSSEEFNAIFTFYDKDGSGFIDENELDALLKDLYEKNKKVSGEE
ncbi:PREDICTED: calretinin [Nipponia nippon]|nr:PREDICTED: calretinin [Nipponia nippon]